MNNHDSPQLSFLSTIQFNILCIFLITSSIFLLSSCRLGELLSTLFAAQEWSQNYALMEGVSCSAQEKIDGDIKHLVVLDTKL